MEPFYYVNNDGSADIVICLDDECVEFARELFPAGRRRPCRERLGRVIRSVKVVISAALVLSLPLTAASAAVEREAMSYVYFGSTQAQIQHVGTSAGTVGTVSPSYFNIGQDGSLTVMNVSHSFIDSMRAMGIKITPFLSNHWDRETGERALINYRELAAQVADTVRRWGFDGVNVDIENVNEEYRDLYTAFVRELRRLLPSGRELSVAVAANPDGSRYGWLGSYDYRALGKIADYVFLMTYDEHWDGGSPGSVAGIDFVRRSVEYALTQIDSQKIMLGIPFYGRIWSSDGSLRGAGISLAAISELERRYPSEIVFNELTASPIMVLNITDDMAPPAFGVKLPSGEYHIYYENADSLKEKLSFVGRYNLRGAGNWSAGMETADIWDYYGLWLNGRYFCDITPEFDKNELLALTPEGRLAPAESIIPIPGEKLTRSELTETMSRILDEDASAIFYGDPAEPASRAQMNAALSHAVQHSYSLGRGEPWTSRELDSLARMSTIGGYTGGMFRPDRALNRGETAALFARILPLLK